MASSGAEQEGLSDAERYRVVRSQIEFEAGLISQRLSWFVASQAFLFSAYAITLNAPRDPLTLAYWPQQHLLYHLIPVVAIASGLLIYLAILAGIFAQKHLRQFLERRVGRESMVEFPPVQGLRWTHWLGMTTQLVLPAVFMAVWIVLFVRGL